MKKRYFVYACSFFFSLGGNILGFSLIYRLVDWFSFTPGQIGPFIALGLFFYFLGCNLYHRFGSIFDPIKIFPVAATVVFLVSLPLSYARIPALLYVSYWVLQISTGLYWPPVMAWLTAGLNEKELNREISFFNRSWMGANIAGPLIAGSLYHWNSGANFLILNISYFLVLVLLFSLRQYCLKRGESLSVGGTARDESGPRTRSGTSQAVDKAFDFYRYRGWISACSSTLFLGLLINIVPLHIRDSLGLTERSAGLMLFFRSVAGFLGFSLLARFTGWHFNRRWFYVLQAGLMLCALALLAAGNRLFLFSGIAVLVGFGYAGCYNNSIFYSGATGKNPKKNLALHEIFLSLGNAAGSAGGGIMYQHFRFSGACIALAVALGIGAGALIYLDRKEGSFTS